jgi:hypothetical protein
MAPDSNWEQPWLNPREQLRSQSERLPEGFRELYEATLRALDEARLQRRSNPLQTFELVWAPALDQLNLEEDRRALALNDLIDAHILYRCLRSSLDRAPQLAAVRSDIKSVRKALFHAYEKLQELSTFKEMQAAEEDFDIRYRRGTTRVRRRIDDALLSRLFEIRARDALSGSLRNFDYLLESVAAVGIEGSRGQPRKYSKDFLILRCARIFERYRPDDVTRIRRYESSSTGPKDRGPFFKFALTAYSIVEHRAAESGFEKSARDMLRIRTRHPDVDLRISKNARSDDLIAFVQLSESKRKQRSN